MSSLILEPKRMNKLRIAKFISTQGITSKSEIASSLNLSMPTTLQNVKELIEAGIVEEEGVYESTGGRKAKALAIVRKASYAAGVDITRNHITLVVVNARKEIVNSERIRKPFEDTPAYYTFVKETILEFLNRSSVDPQTVAGVGFSLPGIVDREQKILLFSHVLKVGRISFHNLGSALGMPYELDNDANSAAYAELDDKTQNAVYLSLSNTVGGAIYLQNHLYKGENFKSAEFGHMVIERDGRPCYCGKKGCADAYCSALILQQHGDGTLEGFFEKVRRQDPSVQNVWDEYLDALALTITNLRMLFDCKIVLGGYVGGYLDEFLPQLSQKIMQYGNFDLDVSYLATGKYKLVASAYGAALEHIDAFLERI